ncbi:hypothetical protein LCGC14_1733010, partial [marine sediment metagenome]
TDQGLVLIPDADKTPDDWQQIDFGPVGGNLNVDNFVDGTDYTSGTTTALTLTTAPVTENNLFVQFDGVTQHHNTYSLSGVTLTFDAAIPLGTANIEVQYGTQLAINTPGDGTVTLAKMANMATDSFLGRATAGSGVPEVLSASTARAILGLPQSIKTATPYTVVAGDVGTMLIANLGSAITFDLTAAATLGAGFLAFIKNIGAGTLTIDPDGAETIDGSATMALAQNEWTMIWTEGSNWRSLGAIDGNVQPAFSVHKSGDQSGIVADTLTKLTWPTEIFDTGGIFASDRATPTVAGTYLFTAGCEWASTLDADDPTRISIFKNGSEFKRDRGGGLPSATPAGHGITIEDYANGSGDYYEVFVAHSSTTTQDVAGNSAATWFMGMRIGP